jgi:hypothetical protein
LKEKGCVTGKRKFFGVLRVAVEISVGDFGLETWTGGDRGAGEDLILTTSKIIYL